MPLVQFPQGATVAEEPVGDRNFRQVVRNLGKGLDAVAGVGFSNLSESESRNLTISVLLLLECVETILVEHKR